MSGYQERLIFEGETDRLAEIVRDAMNSQNEAFIPYRGRRVDEAVIFAQLMMRKARILGLYQDIRDERREGAA